MDDGERNLMKTAARILGQRGMSEEALRRKLRQHSEDTAIIEKVIDKLKTLHYLSDADFARERARYRVQVRHQGPLKVRSDLTIQGISESDIGMALDAVTSEQSVRGTMELSAARWIRLHGEIDGLKRLKRLEGHLLRQGFSWDDVVDYLSAIRFNHLPEKPDGMGDFNDE